MKITDLRNELFLAMQGVRAGTIGVDKAKALAQIGQVIVNSAKAEFEFLRFRPTERGTGFVESQFIPGTPDKPRLVNGKAQSGSH